MLAVGGTVPEDGVHGVPVGGDLFPVPDVGLVDEHVHTLEGWSGLVNKFLCDG